MASNNTSSFVYCVFSTHLRESQIEFRLLSILKISHASKKCCPGIAGLCVMPRAPVPAYERRTIRGTEQAFVCGRIPDRISADYNQLLCGENEVRRK